MNDLTFGATLLSMFATLVIAVAVEVARPPVAGPAAIAAGASRPSTQAARTYPRERMTVSVTTASSR